MRIEPTEIDSVLELIPARFSDNRGWFVETWQHQRYREAGIDVSWAQDNESFSSRAGTLRGIHFQTSPHAQAKLVRVISGVIFDVAVDLRRNSPTFGVAVTRTLSAEIGNQLFIPAGFGHGFCTLVPDTVVAYKASSPYDAASELTIGFNDPTLAIAWPMDEQALILSERDRAAPLLDTLTDSLFD